MYEALDDAQAGFLVEHLRDAGYEVQHGIGAGAGGRVYKAVQLSTGQSVAIKLLRLSELEPDVHSRRLERFRREIAFCSGLYHPDIVRLLDSGELDDGTRFAAFEFIPGRTLADLLVQDGALRVQRAKTLMSQLLPPLAYAHGKDIAHRDLKPGNVMITSDAGRDRLKILDFGISISTDSNDIDLKRLTQTHEWVGTPSYAAPEQLRGQVTGPKADLYAWALMFVECLTGTPLVSGRSLAEIISLHLSPTAHALPPALAEHRLGALLLRMLEKNPSRRLGDAHLVQSLLERISLDGLEDGDGYLRESNLASGPRGRRAGLSDTVTDAEQPDNTERRHVTILCCSVKVAGVGALSSADQLDELLDDTEALIHEVLLQFGATFAQAAGGYSLWYFGLSPGHDADARLTVRAALEIVNRMDRLPVSFQEAGLGLAVHVGIHNGPVTVQISDGRRTPVDGLAARVALQLAALEDAGAVKSRILTSQQFRDLVARHAELEPHAEQQGLRVAWRSEPVSVFRLVGESRSSRSRSERAPLVGRVAELNVLLEAWRRAREGEEGSAVLVSGEAGIGKSRLTAELIAQVEREGYRCEETRCLPEWRNAALRPLETLAAQLLGIVGRAPKEAGAAIERRLVEFELDPTVGVPLMCVWLAVPMPGDYVPSTWSPQKQRQLLHALIADLILAGLRRGNVLFVEDLHWADPSTLECLDVVVKRTKSEQALVVLTARPERSFEWSVAPVVVPLAGLNDQDVRRLADELMPDRLRGVDLSGIVSRADGVPLYLEELAIALRARADAGLLPALSQDHGSVAGFEIPVSLRDLLTSRLDHIVRSKQTAQFAAALGREFTLAFLSALYEDDELSLAADLEELTSSQILVKRLQLESPVYIFRHALIRDAAYDSMPVEVRRRVHERIADGIERRFASLGEAQPDILAYHLERAGNGERAIHFWELAAKKSNFASAHVEAIAHVDRALSLLKDGVPRAAPGVEEARLLLTRGAILVGKRGYTDPDAKSCFERIVELVPPRGDTLTLAFSARWCLWYYHNTRANLRESSLLADELRRLAESADEPALSLSAWTAICESRFCTGKLEEAVLASRRCAAEYDFERHRYLALSYGDDPHLASLAFESLAELVRGRPAVAAARVAEGIELAERLGFPALLAGMYGQAAWVYLNWGSSGAQKPRLDLARQHAARAMSLSQEHGFPFWELYGKMNDSAARIAEGDSGAVTELRACAEFWQLAGANLGRCWHLTFIAQGLRLSGDFSGALAALDEAFEFCRTNDSRYFEAEVRRQRAELLGDPANPDRDRGRALSECVAAAADAKLLGASWWQMASLVTAARLEDEPDAQRMHELASLIAEFSMDAPETPPLVAEALELVRATATTVTI